MVVGVGQRRDRAQPELGDGVRVGALVFAGYADRADAQDEALAGEQTRDGMHRADRPRVGDRARRAREVVR